MLKKPITKIVFISAFIITGCSLFPSNKTVNIYLNPKNNGWYFIQIRRDSTLIDTGTLPIKFDDTTRLIKITINSIDKTILSPYDYAGNDISPRLKFLGILEAKGERFFEFYNPTDEELMNIDKWMPTNERAWKIRLDEHLEFDKHYKANK